ncbi:MAG: hypothetical protein HY381_01890, partial [Candidatus Chisholmbacteria bacterium]|nr:hypothetical protein [Candidatus Chisholmbacteria bacterium]
MRVGVNPSTSLGTSPLRARKALVYDGAMALGFNLVELIQQISYLGLFGMVFAESGLFFGFFLPGDSLLFTAGFLASQGFLKIFL